jgi:Trypsin-like peptidase domain
MFAEALQLASKYTFPVLISNRFYDGTVESGIGSFVILNQEGWILTAAHILGGLQAHQQHLQEMANAQNAHLTTTRPSPNPKWITNHSMWFGADHHVVSQFHVLQDNDLAIGKIENYSPSFVKEYPVFKNPAHILSGTSLCKLGYPFYDVKASFDMQHQAFRFDPSIFPIPTFPMDGIMTRNVITGKSNDGLYEYKWLETSSPGLRGQSGGPTFDKEGKIWAIQSQTRHMPLGFSPTIKKGDQEIEENQFLNVGWGVHVETILKFLDFYGVKYSVA